MMMPTKGDSLEDEALPEAFTAIIGNQKPLKEKKFFNQDLQFQEKSSKIQALSIITVIRDSIFRMDSVVKMIFAVSLVTWGIGTGDVVAEVSCEGGALPGCRLEVFFHEGPLGDGAGAADSVAAGAMVDCVEGGDASLGDEGGDSSESDVMTVRTTAYTHTEADHVKWANKTATGSTLRYGKVRSAAADWSRYPVGTRFRIVGEPAEYVVEDYGSALVGKNTIDLYKPSRRAMKDWGVRVVEIEIVEWGSVENSLAILKPRVAKSAAVRQMVASLQERERGEGESIEGRG